MSHHRDVNLFNQLPFLRETGPHLSSDFLSASPQIRIIMHYPSPPHPPPQRPPPARPPPPGFERGQAAAITHASATHKTTSFNNLALALGTNLAECMDDSCTIAGIATVPNTNHITAAAAAAARQQTMVSDSDTHLARQSRHSVSRIISAKNNGSVIGSSSSSQSQQQQQLQLSGEAMLKSGYLMTQQQYNNYLTEKQAQQAHAQKQAQQLNGGEILNNNSSRNNFDNKAINQQQQSDQRQHDVQQQQRSMMMMGAAWENNTNNKFCISPNNENVGNISNLHHSDTSKKYTTHNIGLTVVEPTMTPPLWVGSDGLLYPLLQHQQQQMQQQQQHHHVVVGSAASNGRASAPPISRTSASTAAIGSVGMNIYPNINNRLVAYATNSLQMRVAELHKELKHGDHPAANNISHHTPAHHHVMSTPTPNTCTSAQSTISSVGSALLVPPLPGNITIVSSSSASAGGAVKGGGVNSQITHRLPSSSSSSFIIDNPVQKRMELLSARELVPFLREIPPKGEEQRGLVILYGSMLYNILSDVRMTCEAFGTLESFRSDFGDSRGIFFVTYYDLRSAQLAVAELPRLLNDMLLVSGGNKVNDQSSSSFDGGSGVQVKYCIPLNSSSATADGTILLLDLPGTIDEQDLIQVLSSFGEVRDIHYQANISNEDEDGNELTSYLVEFYDIQDANQAILELEHTHPWGEGVKIKVGTRSPAKKKLGKELLLLMSNWRKSPISGSPALSVSPGASAQLPTSQMITANAQNLEASSNPTAASTEVNYRQHQLPPQDQMRTAQSQSYYQYANVQSTVGHPPHHQQCQLVMGPDGQYRYVMSSGSTPHYSHSQIIGHPYGHAPSQPQQVMYAPSSLEQQYIHSQSQLISPMAPPQQYQVHYDLAAHQPVIDYQRQPSLSTQFTHMSVVTTDVNTDSLSSTSLSGRGVVKPLRGSPSTGKKTMTGSNNVKEDDVTNNATLMLDDIRTGKDHRSSLMVRNIPNKYTQQMLLNEFAGTGHGPDKMDFFYLPIDFKNRCNRGYAFVNFVNYKDIIPFFSQYNDCKWNRFNSDKICCITYARIQGKNAMIKKFEHSSVMEKDDEYRPMVFVSHGERKGQVESIKDAAVGMYKLGL